MIGRPRLLPRARPWHTTAGARGDTMRARSAVQGCLAGVALAWGALGCAPLGAETLAELDALSDRSVDEAAGIAAANEQAGRGAYLEALATLERVLAVHPK